MFEIVSCKMENITPQKAKDYLELNTHEAQRALSPKRVDFHVRKIQSGQFRTGEIAFALNGKGAEVLINGQHQLYAVVKSGFPIKAKVERAKCKDKLEVSDYYRQFDNPLSNRPFHDMVGVEAWSRGITWKLKFCKLIASANAYLATPGVKHRYLSPDEKAEYLSYKLDGGEFVNRILAEGNPPSRSAHLQKLPTVIVMLQSWGISHADADEFWELVRDGGGLAYDDPIRSLRDWLLSFKARDPKSTNAHATVTQREIMGRCINSWNAWCNGEKRRSTRYVSGKDLPKMISRKR